MLNYLWGFMIIIGTIFAAFTGNLPSVTEAALDSAKEAVTLHYDDRSHVLLGGADEDCGAGRTDRGGF